jgi:hypothetical protein
MINEYLTSQIVAGYSRSQIVAGYSRWRTINITQSSKKLDTAPKAFEIENNALNSKQDKVRSHM